MEIKAAKSEEDITKCLKVIKELRPHLNDDEFTGLIKQMMDEGYQLAYVEVEGVAVSAIGFRYLQFLFNGRHFYIDDLVTLTEHRGKGYGGILLEYVFELARKEGFETVTLDSGHHRYPAHRLYLNKGFDIQAHHFVKKL